MLCAILSLTILVVSVSGQDEDALAGLAVNIPGLPGQDYPIFAFPPETSFLCDNQIQGYYGDPEADCKLGLLNVSFSYIFYLQAKHSIFVPMMVMMDSSSTVFFAPMEPSSISNTSSVTGGLMLIAPKWNLFTVSMKMLLQQPLLLMVTGLEELKIMMKSLM